MASQYHRCRKDPGGRKSQPPQLYGNSSPSGKSAAVTDIHIKPDVTPADAGRRKPGVTDLQPAQKNAMACRFTSRIFPKKFYRPVKRKSRGLKAKDAKKKKPE